MLKRQATDQVPYRRTGNPLVVLITLTAIGLFVAGCSSSGGDSAEQEGGTDETAESTDAVPSIDEDANESGASDIERYGFDPEGVDTAEVDELTFGEDLDEGPEDLPDLGPAEVTPPSQVLAAFDSDEIDAIEKATQSPDIAILDAASFVDEGPTAEEIAANGDGRSRTDAGRLIVLDENASLACANIEMAIANLDADLAPAATDQVQQAALRAAESSVNGMADWAEALDASADSGEQPEASTLVGFLTACVEGGHEL